MAGGGRSLMNKLGVLVLMAGLAAPAAFANTNSFDQLKTGEPPAGWTATQTGEGHAKWAVVADETAPSKPNVLKQSGEATFPLCFEHDTRLKNGFVEVKFKTVSGKVDQAAGVVWRCQDADNYYIARANANEDNVTIYHTLKGKRVSFKSFDIKVTAQQWHALRVDFAGNQFTVTFDGLKVIEATDDSLSAPGRVGVWTKADSVILFDDFSYGAK